MLYPLSYEGGARWTGGADSMRGVSVAGIAAPV
ncbi:hypothetical protein RR21198_1378 [Rhodococcus rhodochrous ATCC 21198]|nr:hypothetical protein RR21198_1378 [Rhodococcus rhodochrous ATCC 21198]